MPSRKSRSHHIAKQLTELSIAAPQVVMHRTARMAAAGNVLSARDQVELTRMSSEKVLAFYQSWAGMWMAAYAVQVELGRSLLTSLLSVGSGGKPNAMSAVAASSGAAAKVLAAGLAPVHKAAVANAKRLALTKK